MRVKYIVILLLAMALTFAVPVSGNLVSTVFGFPVITQSGASTAFNQYLASASDTESFDLGFLGDLNLHGMSMGSPQSGKIHMNGFNFDKLIADPAYIQNSNQVQTVSSTNFAQTGEAANFAYPFTGVGAISLPGFGFGF
jgi:hypothetical protein